MILAFIIAVLCVVAVGAYFGPLAGATCTLAVVAGYVVGVIAMHDAVHGPERR